MKSASTIRPHDPLADALPWLQQPLAQALRHQRSHALLAVGQPGVGQLSFALALARAWLCEADGPRSAQPRREPACGRCASCLLVSARTHPDLLVIAPQAVQEALGWSGDEDDAGDAGEGKGKAKASNEIKVEAVRRVVAFAQQTSSRGGAKVVVLHPAEQMNAISANTLLKTLEEPAGTARFVLSSGAPDRLLPTIRSRCQAIALPTPGADAARAWLQGQGVADAGVLLAAAGGQPLSALELGEQGMDRKTWLALPQQMRAGSTQALAGWPVPRVIDMLQKLAVDALRAASGREAVYFPDAGLPQGGDLVRLSAWASELRAARRHAEHPLNANLQTEALVQRARAALQTA
ncbi:MAG: DNA polymerase III subunit delta' [Aquabacterium sp.]|nr:MAG: DNA polymerase III subunit delta' [Aquabacterium sp.]